MLRYIAEDRSRPLDWRKAAEEKKKKKRYKERQKVLDISQNLQSQTHTYLQTRTVPRHASSRTLSSSLISPDSSTMVSFTKLLALGLTFASSSIAYSNKYSFPSLSSYVHSLTPRSCKGSAVSLGPHLGDCFVGIRKIDQNAMYNDQAQFSYNNCYLKYATNGSGAKPIKGIDIVNKINEIIASCRPPNGYYSGSFGTGNCDACHVTVNYRACKFLKSTLRILSKLTVFRNDNRASRVEEGLQTLTKAR